MVDARDNVKHFENDIWDRDIAVNLTGAYNITREVYPNMKERGFGRIISMSSMAGWQGGFGQLSYSATKAALIGFGKALTLGRPAQRHLQKRRDLLKTHCSSNTRHLDQLVKKCLERPILPHLETE